MHACTHLHVAHPHANAAMHLYLLSQPPLLLQQQPPSKNKINLPVLPHPPPPPCACAWQVLALCLDRGPLVVPMTVMQFGGVMLLPIIPAQGVCGCGRGGRGGGGGRRKGRGVTLGWFMRLRLQCWYAPWCVRLCVCHVVCWCFLTPVPPLYVQRPPPHPYSSRASALKPLLPPHPPQCSPSAGGAPSPSTRGGRIGGPHSC